MTEKVSWPPAAKREKADDPGEQIIDEPGAEDGRLQRERRRASAKRQMTSGPAARWPPAAKREMTAGRADGWQPAAKEPRRLAQEEDRA